MAGTLARAEESTNSRDSMIRKFVLKLIIAMLVGREPLRARVKNGVD